MNKVLNSHYGQKLREDAARWDRNTLLLGDDGIVLFETFVEDEYEGWVETFLNFSGLELPDDALDATNFILSQIEIEQDEDGNLSFSDPTGYMVDDDRRGRLVNGSWVVVDD